MKMTAERWERTNQYLDEVFGDADETLADYAARATEAGLPDIAVNAVVGRMLQMLVSMTAGRVAIEVGTLGGYSGTWIARGLPPDGVLHTIEIEPKHAAFARDQFKRAGVADRVSVIEGDAMSVLKELAASFEPGSVDVVFLDAVKEEYPAYWKVVRPLIADGGLIIADNALGSNSWWIDVPDHPSRQAADRFNRLVAGDQDFTAFAVPLRQGVMVGRRTSHHGG